MAEAQSKDGRARMVGRMVGQTEGLTMQAKRDIIRALIESPLYWMLHYRERLSLITYLMRYRRIVC